MSIKLYVYKSNLSSGISCETINRANVQHIEKTIPEKVEINVISPSISHPRPRETDRKTYFFKQKKSTKTENLTRWLMFWSIFSLNRKSNINTCIFNQKHFSSDARCPPLAPSQRYEINHWITKSGALAPRPKV